MNTYTTSNTFQDLRNGDSMSQEEFHRLYEYSPTEFRAELLDGTVYVCEPLFEPHADIHARVISLFDAYRAMTMGVQALVDASVILGVKDEVQPDLLLRILPDYQGQTSDYWFRKGKRTRGPYVKGAPELMVEVAFSSRSMDLNIKRKRYQDAGVLEYLVICLQRQQLIWFDFANQQELKANRAGVFQSGIFPGLWIHQTGLFNMNYKLTMDTMHKGLSSEQHEAFLLELQERSKRPG